MQDFNFRNLHRRRYFLSDDEVIQLVNAYDTPLWVLSEDNLRLSCRRAKDFPNLYGLTVRYAMKAWSLGAVLKIVDQEGLHIDASSGFEVWRALRADIKPERIQLTCQEMPEPHELQEFVRLGVKFNASSLHQLQTFGELFPHQTVSIRINPGFGSSKSADTNVGGLTSSFGIWHEYLHTAMAIAKSCFLEIDGIHFHIGSAVCTKTWKLAVKCVMTFAKEVPTVTRMSLGGGFDVGRMPNDRDMNIVSSGRTLLPLFEQFAADTGRRLHVEIEPGAFIVAHAGALVMRIHDIVDTGEDGFVFYKVDGGMNELLQPADYGMEHHLVTVPRLGHISKPTKQEVVVVGHCCETGDCLTMDLTDTSKLAPRTVSRAEIDDYMVAYGTGGYNDSCGAKDYNSFPTAAVVIKPCQGDFALVRERETLDDILRHERWPY